MLKVTLSTPFELIKAIGLTLRDRQLFLYSLAPWLLGCLSFGLSLWLAVNQRQEILGFLPWALPGWIVTALSWLWVLVAIPLAALLAYLMTITLGSVFLELIVDRVLTIDGVTPPSPSSWAAMLRELARSLIATAVRLLYVLTLALVAAVLSFFPFLLLIPLLINGFIVGWDLIDTPQGKFYSGFSDRRKQAFKHKGEVLGLGLWFSLTFLVPFLSVLLLPVATVVATRRVLRWQEASPAAACAAPIAS